MIDYRDADLVKPGTQLIAVGTRDLLEITEGQTYRAIHGAEEGIFSSRPYVTVQTDSGGVGSYHLSRFDFPETPDPKDYRALAVDYILKDRRAKELQAGNIHGIRYLRASHARELAKRALLNYRGN